MTHDAPSDAAVGGLRVACMAFFDPHSREDVGLLRQPYGIEELERLGMSLVHVPVDWGRRRPLRDITAVQQMVRYSTEADVVFAMFESQANATALARRLHVPGARRAPLVVLTCWLGQEALKATGARRIALAQAYRSVDRLLVFSLNQREILEARLGVDRSRLTVVPFGVDFQWFQSAKTADNGYLVSVGRDRGRDWRTLFDAVRGTGIEVRVACRPAEIYGLDIPDEVVVEGFVSRDRYRELLAGATAVILPTHVRAYPTGQSVALEAMSMGKCVIATATPALADYLDDASAVLTTVANPTALRSAIQHTLDNGEMRRRLGRSGQSVVKSRFTSKHMWSAVASVLAKVADR